MQTNGEEPQVILYLQEARQSPERLTFVPPPPVQCCALCDECDHFITDCATLELFQRWYLVNPVYHLALLAIKNLCQICGGNHPLHHFHYIPRFRLQLTSLCMTIICISLEDKSDMESMDSSKK